MNVKLDQAGRVVVPSSIRAEFGVEPGDELSFDHHQGNWIIRPARPCGHRVAAPALDDWCDEDEPFEYKSVPPRLTKVLKLSDPPRRRVKPAPMDFDDE